MRLSVALLLWPVAALLRGAVLVTLWRWYMVPFGLPAISIPQGLGLALIVGFLTHQERHDTDDDTWGRDVISALITPPLVLFFGWVYSWWL